MRDNASKGIGQYRRMEVGTADRGRLLLMMFAGALRFLRQAETKLAEDDLVQFGHYLGRAQAVIAELLHTLDREAGGEIATNLERLYRFMLDHLLEANLQRSAQCVSQVRRLLEIIADAYGEVLADGRAPGLQVDAA